MRCGAAERLTLGRRSWPYRSLVAHLNGFPILSSGANFPNLRRNPSRETPFEIDSVSQSPGNSRGPCIQVLSAVSVDHAQKNEASTPGADLSDATCTPDHLNLIQLPRDFWPVAGRRQKSSHEEFVPKSTQTRSLICSPVSPENAVCDARNSQRNSLKKGAWSRKGARADRTRRSNRVRSGWVSNRW
jgi:hypothetical protein